MEFVEYGLDLGWGGDVGAVVGYAAVEDTEFFRCAAEYCDGDGGVGVKELLDDVASYEAASASYEDAVWGLGGL